jgi:hypothetical protein
LKEAIQQQLASATENSHLGGWHSAEKKTYTSYHKKLTESCMFNTPFSHSNWFNRNGVVITVVYNNWEHRDQIEAGSIILTGCIRYGQKCVLPLADISVTETTGNEIWNRKQDTDDDEPMISRPVSGTKRKAAEMTSDDDGVLPAPGSAHPPPFSLSEDSPQDLQVLRQDIHRFVNIQAQYNRDTVSVSMIQSVCMSKDHLKREHGVNNIRELKRNVEGWYSSNDNVELRLVNAASEKTSEWKAFYDEFHTYPAVNNDSGEPFKSKSGYHVFACVITIRK